MTCTLFVFLLLHLLAAAAASAGLFSGEVSGDFEVVVPRRVDASGTPVSEALEHHHSRRWRRDAASAGDELHVEVPLRESTLRLRLWPSVDFVAPHLSVHRPAGRGRRSLGAFHSCHFQGLVLGQPNSKVALSACNGLVGMVRSEKHGTLWIEPLKNSTRGANGHHHIVYSKKKSSSASNNHSCGTKDPNRTFKKRDFEKRRVKRSSSFYAEPTFGRPRGGRSADDGFGFSESRERHVEALVVADRSMMDFHDKESATDLETYLLTIMNMVSAFYRIPSLGNRINIVVVKLRIEDENLQQNGLSFNVTTNADKTLDSFCLWQRKVNSPEQDHPDHHDVAILLTRVDICSKSDKPCGTLGVAHVSGMCDNDRACSVNQDNGLSVAHTVAHELGHNFGMVHDAGEEGGGGVDSAECVSRNGSQLHIMTPNLDIDTSSMEWSECSQHTITAFFDRGDGECLDDLPKHADESTQLPDLPAGALYDADHQCRLQYSSLATSVCSEEDDFCSYLWCTVNNTCTTTLRPPADGTNCGHRKWCMGRKCVEVRASAAPVHGGWGEWGEFSDCSRTCGGGVATSERRCDHPKPAHSGHYCTGLRKRFRVCNTHTCPRGEPGFRATQCSAFDPAWKPYVDKVSPCALFCTHDSLIVEATASALDGTPCSPSSNDMCIEGKCKRVGCDWRIDSTAEEDACGVCDGDGSQCVTHSNVFTKKEGKGMVVVAEVPAAAHNVRVEEMGNARTFIALGASEKRLVVDGRSLGKGETQDLLVAGSTGTYERWGQKESLMVRGPTNESLKIYVLYPGKARNLGVRFEYTVKRKPGERPPQFHWHLPDWSACSVTCGNGIQVARPHCAERTYGLVDNVKCLATGPPPSPLMRACNQSPCPAKWWSGPWQLCPATCSSPKARRHRTVLCVRSGDDGAEFEALPDADCDAASRPAEEESCTGLPPCDATAAIVPPQTKKSVIKVAAPSRAVRQRPLRRHRKRAEARAARTQLTDHTFQWHLGNWSHCSKNCGEGTKRRGVVCHLMPNSHRVSAKHCPAPKPADNEPCNTRACLQWTTSAWSACDCDGTGLSTRIVTCPKHRQCSDHDKPEVFRDCLHSCKR